MVKIGDYLRKVILPLKWQVCMNKLADFTLDFPGCACGLISSAIKVKEIDGAISYDESRSIKKTRSLMLSNSWMVSHHTPQPVVLYKS